MSNYEYDAEEELVHEISKDIAEAIDKEILMQMMFPGSQLKTCTWIDERLPYGQQRMHDECRVLHKGDTPVFPKREEYLRWKRENVDLR